MSRVHPLNQMRWRAPARVELSGVTDWGYELAQLAEELGRFGRAVAPPSERVIEEAHEHDRDLTLRWTETDTDYREVQPSPRLLFKFADLAEKPPAAYVAFAKRYGPLDLCRHGKPSSHVPAEVLDDLAAPYRDLEEQRDLRARDYELRLLAEEGHLANEDEKPPGPAEFPAPLLSCHRPAFSDERLDIWRSYARQANTMIDLLGELMLSRPTSPARWRPLASLYDEPIEALVREPPPVVPARAPERERAAVRTVRAEVLADQRLMLAWFVSQWLHLGGIRPRFTWSRRASAQLDLVGSGGLFAALAIQLADLVNDQDQSLIRCTACGRRYRPHRKPRADQDNFCPKESCQAARKRRYRRRKADG